ncbi:hypothetical protein BH24CHL8_BH24CHL8_10910 [soil metagenome]
MRKRDLIQLFDYMHWVNRRLLKAAARLPPGAFTAPSTVTTRDLRATLGHELDVEWSWLCGAVALWRGGSAAPWRARRILTT